MMYLNNFTRRIVKQRSLTRVSRVVANGILEAKEPSKSFTPITFEYPQHKRNIYEGYWYRKPSFLLIKRNTPELIKNENELLLWETCLDDFYNSLGRIVKQRSLTRVSRVVANGILEAKEFSETKILMEELLVPYKQVYNRKYGKSIYKTVVHVQKEEEIFASASKKKRDIEKEQPLPKSRKRKMHLLEHQSESELEDDENEECEKDEEDYDDENEEEDVIDFNTISFNLQAESIKDGEGWTLKNGEKVRDVLIRMTSKTIE
ncbi:hypothetical protein Glove_26g218 [Diversispora epigaea]|uniref:Uncharacterized protein n=1 Tax=Diversispora epigaea TaxID=1348612 RepID=A0A397JMN7_9GLOM|nr:hypothetical protein Glove_26g218 [Diversispora epigaea]